MPVTATITIEGKPLKPEFVIQNIDVEQEMNRIPRAQFTLEEHYKLDQGFSIGKEKSLAPGGKVEIKLRTEGDPDSEKVVFIGAITAKELHVNADRAQLTLCLRDAALQTTVVRKNAHFQKMSDSAILKKILGEYGDLAQEKIDETKPKYESMVQYYCSDWDFILSRADANGLLVLVSNGKISILKPKLKGTGRKIRYGVNELCSINLKVDLQYGFDKIKAVSWDQEKQSPTPPVDAADLKIAPGKIDPAKGAAKLGTKEYLIYSPEPMDADELQALADAQRMHSGFSLVRGTIVIPGDASCKLGETIELEDFADDYNGKALITGVRQMVTEQSWTTALQIGLPVEGYRFRQDIMERPASGLLPAVTGLQVGIVDAFKEDEKGLFRVRLKVPGFFDSKDAVWARLMTPDAGNERGYMFRPETGDEVLVGFLNEDPRHPIVLGGLYNAKNKPPSAPEEENKLKGIYTKEKLKIEFDDDKKTLLIQTPGERKILLDDDKESITILDASDQNQLVMDDKGILLKSKGKISIEADGAVTLKSGEKIEFDAPKVDSK